MLDSEITGKTDITRESEITQTMLEPDITRESEIS